MIRTFLMLSFWTLMMVPVVLLCFPWTLITGDVRFIYHVGMWTAITGVRLAGVRIHTVGLEKIDPTRTYIFMSNHVSNLDPPLMLPLIPRRTSVMAKKELFDIPLLGKTMRLGSLVPVDRKNRDAGITAVRAAADVIRKGINMTIYVEGGRSFDGKLIPFKKGPFYLAAECGVPVVPVTVVGTHHIMPKGRSSIQPGNVNVIFHDPIEPRDFGDRDALKVKVREVINSGLPEEFQSALKEALEASQSQV